ncbi:MAG: 1-acyl-sn-glycerol-3-phosphate acyltransferase [Alphaproteobacteria bacterium]|nr:1-acyl-sn-glycerol-3-phosphate acyltransferase [Alphaproteobacteria bacterium]
MRFLTLCRSLIFQFFFYLWSATVIIGFLPTLIMPDRYTLWMPITWGYGTRFLLWAICGTHIRATGLENLPKKSGYIIASKHESAMETTLFHTFVPDAFYVLKQVLGWLPFMCFYFKKTHCILIDRKGGAVAMRAMLEKTKKNLQLHKTLIIFPEGTRVKPRTKTKYNPGVALLYEQCKVPVVPVALNTGYFWPKNDLYRYSGTATFAFLPPIQPGLEKRQFLEVLENTIEDACAKLDP